MSGNSKREQIVETADRLFYENGFEPTSFAQIAEKLGISRGNFYYHFKSKDEILDAVIRRRLADTDAMLEAWEIEGDTPIERIRSFIDILIVNRAKIQRFGCPVGTLSAELAKLNHPLQPNANELFTLFRTWLRRQFDQLGYNNEAANDLAMHLLARSQGVATLASAFQDEAFIYQEVGRLYEWIDSHTKKEH